MKQKAPSGYISKSYPKLLTKRYPIEYRNTKLSSFKVLLKIADQNSSHIV